MYIITTFYDKNPQKDSNLYFKTKCAILDFKCKLNPVYSVIPRRELISELNFRLGIETKGQLKYGLCRQ